jgi:hypothetical protein
MEAMMTIKQELLSQTVNQLVVNLSSHEFVLENRGQVLALYTPDRSMKLEIIFRLPAQRFKGRLKVIPKVQICSRSIKKWWKKEQLPDPTDVFFHARLCDIIPRVPAYEWIISGEEQAQAVKEITWQINQFLMPFFNKLTDTENTVHEICKNVWGIIPGLKYDICDPPLDYIIYYGSIEIARKFFNNCIERNILWAKQVAIRYKELANKQGVSMEQIFNSGSRWINLSYISKLRE